jgi:outer membrane protein OmpA-like peptidoglycan-associated protein
MKQVLIISVLLVSTFIFGQVEQLKIYFDVDEFQLDQQDETALDNLLKLPVLKVLSISGYTDVTGSEQYNKLLAQKRAHSVYSYIKGSITDASLVNEVVGRGESSNFGGFSKNRVVIIAYEPVLAKKSSHLVQNKSKLSDQKTKPSETDHKSVTRDGVLEKETIALLKIGDILNLGGIEFLPGSHKLTNKSYKALGKLIEIMKNNPQLEIEIQGHICCQAKGDGLDNDTGTMNLSENRAKQVYSELLMKGIDNNRMAYKGYGAVRKLEEEVNEEARQRNRRVSILILNK